MKRLSYKIISLIVITLLIGEAEAKKRDEVERKRAINKSYNVSPQHILDITNKFGRVHVNTWAKKEFDVKIEIIARGRNEERAQQVLDQIEVKIVEAANLIRFETELKGNIDNKKSETFEINYLVNMPPSNALNLKNSFGETYLADFSGDLDLDVSYGDIKLGSLTGDSNVEISFSDGEIDEVRKGRLTIKYSDVDVKRTGDVKMQQGYSDVSIETAGNLQIDTKYSDLKIGQLDVVAGNLDYSDFSLGQLMVSMEMETSYSGGFRVEQVAKNFKKINLEGKFGSFRLGFEEGVNCNFETKLKFCDMNYSGLDVDLSYKMKEDFRNEYRGKIGKGSGGVISIVSSYGDVKLFKN